ncbi:MAG: VCBS repeat-containing protein [Phycisphaerae bacterium]|nr:VCBS repeat-containing protein [Phycisphaerae bacterium]
MLSNRQNPARGCAVLPCVLLAVLLIEPPIAGAGEDAARLHGLGGLDGIGQTYLTAPQRRLEVVRGEGETTDGDGAVLFGGRAPVGEGSKYFGIMVRLEGAVDLRDRAVAFDARTPTADATRAFYVRFYNQGQSKPAWSFVSWGGPLKGAWRRFTLQQGLCLDGLAWEAGVVEDRVADKVDRIEFIIGTRDSDVDVLAAVDDVRLAARRPGIQELTEPKRLARETRVVVEGKAAAVVLHPDSAEGRAAAGAVVAMIREKTGVAIPARVGTERDRQPETTAILVGNVETNPAMLLLYARYMTPVDAVCPGKGGWLVHTVFDPFGKGVGAVVVGASDSEGLGKGVAVLGEVMQKQASGRSLSLPRVFERKYGAEFLGKYGWAGDAPAGDRLEKGLAEGRSALDRGRHTSIAGVLSSVATRYLLTGHGVEAKVFVKLWEMYGKSAVADPRKFGGPWGFDSDFPSCMVVAGWRNIEYDPSLTDEERLATTKTMGRWLREAVVPSCAGAVESSHVPHNHQTFPALGTLLAGLYFTEGWRVAEGELWLGIADAIFRRQAGYSKPWEDCNGYQWLTNGHLIRYTVARPDFTLYENGNARRIIDYCIGTMDNLGYQVPYGDTGSWQCWDTETICLDTFAKVTGDPAARWAGNLKHRIKESIALSGFQRAGAEGEPPSTYNGVRVWPLDAGYYRSHGWRDRPGLAKCFDKVSFRDRMDPNAAYLLLDGLSNGGHKHFDGNSVPRMTLYGRIWLADNDYYKSAVKYHNSMMVFKDGESAAIPAYAELLSAGQTARCGFSRSRMGRYAGVDWERTIVWLKEREGFVVLDKLTAIETDEYQFRVLWHGIGKASLRDEGLLLEQKGPGLWVQVAPGPELRLYEDAELGKNWKGYPYAEPVVRSLSAIATVRLEKGKSYLFASALHGSAKGGGQPWSIRHAAEGDGVVVKAGDGALVVGLSGFGVPTARGVLATDAEVVVAEAGGTSLLHARHAKAGDRVLLEGGEARSVDIEDAATEGVLAGMPTRAATPNLKAEGKAAEHVRLWEETLSSRLAGPTSRGTSSETKAKAGVKGESRYRITRLATACLDGRGGPLVVLAATREGRLFAVSAEGRVRWSVELGAQINDVTADDLDGDGVDEIVVGGQDHHVRVLDASGKERWRRALTYYRRPPYVNVVRMGDLDGDGRREVVAGGENWRFYAFKADGTELWNYESVHPSRSGAVADLDGDGKAEVMCGTHYYYMSVLNPDGTKRWGYNFGPICYDLATGSFDGDKRRGVVCGGGGGYVHYLSFDGKLRMKYDTGDEVRRVAAADLDGDGRDEVLAGSLNHNVYCFGADGKRRWRVDLGRPISAMAAVADGKGSLLLAGTSGGVVVTIDPSGTIVASSRLGAEVVDLAVLGVAAVAATSDGRLVAVRVR